MKLYDAAWGPSPRRVRIFLAEKGIDVERVELDLRKNGLPRDLYLAVNPRGAVPALEIDGGELLCESSAICRYFDAAHPEPPLFGRTPIEIGRIEAWTRRIEYDGFIPAVYVFRNSAPNFKDQPLVSAPPSVPQIPELATRGTIMWTAFIEGLNGHLADGRRWITGESYSFADVTALVTLDFARSANLLVPARFGHVLRWHEAASERPSARA